MTVWYRLAQSTAILLLCNLAITEACASTRQRTISGDSLKLNLEIRYTQVDDATVHPVAVVTIENAGSTSVAFSKTFGTTNRPWLVFEIETVRGDRVHYPMEVDLFTMPKYVCLDPEEKIVWEIDLLEWYVVVGGVREESHALSFDLKPGIYRLRVLYSDEKNKVKVRCPMIQGTVKSDWVEFEVQ